MGIEFIGITLGWFVKRAPLEDSTAIVNCLSPPPFFFFSPNICTLW